jgi:predicted TIM-barrel fold metal-dependent hydrolase
MRRYPAADVLILVSLSLGVAAGQQPADPIERPRVWLDEFRPRSMLRVPQHELTQARFPVVDVHTHFGLKLRGGSKALDEYVKLMDRNQIAVCVSLDGQLGDAWDEHAKLLWANHRQRFVIFVHLDWQGDGDPDDVATWDCHRPDFARRTAESLRVARNRGASGLKVFKEFGLSLRNPDGTLVRIDDPRFDPIWEACGRLGMPVLIHTADPAAFFEPIDATNERLEELGRHPEWSFHGERFPARDELLAARNHVIARHPDTVFIAAHLANDGEDLQQLAEWLDAYPNLYVDIASRIAELGRQPFTARRFMIQYADRILFGTDGPWPETRVRLYWRFMETEDEYFPYSEKPFPPQGFWQIYGVNLPNDVLRKIYYANAARIIPGVEERLRKRERGRDSFSSKE